MNCKMMILKRNGQIKSEVPGYPVVPVIVILFSLALIVNTVVVQPTVLCVVCNSSIFWTQQLQGSTKDTTNFKACQ